jgi:hypothetical protein
LTWFLHSFILGAIHRLMEVWACFIEPVRLILVVLVKALGGLASAGMSSPCWPDLILLVGGQTLPFDEARDGAR